MITLAHPYLLLLLLLLPGVAGFVYLADRARKKRWALFVAPRLQSRLFVKGNPFARWLSLAFLLASVAALIAALSRPQGGSSSTVEISRGKNVIFILDLSRSMLSADVKPDRLSQAKAILYEILDGIPEDRVGLIGFAGCSHVLGPLTVDHGALRETIEQLTPDSMPEGGTDLGSALVTAIKCFHDTGQHNNALVVISDGEDHANRLISAVRGLAKEGVYAFAVGVGTEDGDYIPDQSSPDGKFHDRDGNPVITRLQPEILRQLARETGGRFVTAKAGADIPAMAAAAFREISASEIRGRKRYVSSEFYQWFVLPAVLFLMASIFASTRWRVTTVSAALALFMHPAPLRADGLHEAYDAMRSANYGRARYLYGSLASRDISPVKAAPLRFAEGLAAYRSHAFSDAESAFSAALLSEDPRLQAAAHDGCGIALFQLGWISFPNDVSLQEQKDKADRMKVFDEMVRAKLKIWFQGKGGASQETAPNREFEQIVRNWTDAVRHFRSASSLQPNDESAVINRETTMKYLKRLEELLKDYSDQTAKSLPPPRQPKTNPKQGDHPDNPSQSPGDQPKNTGGQADKEKKNDMRHLGDSPPPRRKDDPSYNSGNPQQPESRADDKTPQPETKPGETQEQRARRILSDNADIRRGPLAPGHHEFIRPEKDW